MYLTTSQKIIKYLIKVCIQSEGVCSNDLTVGFIRYFNSGYIVYCDVYNNDIFYVVEYEKRIDTGKYIFI